MIFSTKVAEDLVGEALEVFGVSSSGDLGVRVVEECNQEIEKDGQALLDGRRVVEVVNF